MELNLSGASLSSQILVSILIVLVGFIGRRVMLSMDRMAGSVEELNKNMAITFSKMDGFEKRIEHLEHRARRIP